MEWTQRFFVFVLVGYFSITSVQASNHDFEVVVRNVSSTHIFFELVNGTDFQNFKYRLGGCEGDTKRIISHYGINKRYYNLTGLTADTVYIAHIEITTTTAHQITKKLTFKTPSASGPTRFNNFHVTAVTTTTITVAWDPNGYNDTFYRISVSPGSSSIMYDVNSSSFTRRGLVPGRQYSIQMSSADGKLHSGVVSTRTLSSENQPRNLVISNVYHDSFDLHWERAKDDNSITYEITGNDLKSSYSTNKSYAAIEVKDTSKPTASFTINGITRTVKLSTKKRPYIMNVWAPNARGDSLTVMWQRYPGATSYTVRYWKTSDIGGVTDVPNIENNNYTITSLESDTEHMIEVRTLIQYTPITSKQTSLRTQKLNRVNSIVNIMAIKNFNKSVTLVWSHSFDTQEYRIDSGSVQTTTENMITLDNLPLGSKTINFKLTKYNGVTLSSPVASTNFTVNIATPMIEGISVGDISSAGITIKWKKLHDINEYRVYYHKASESAMNPNMTRVIRGTHAGVFSLSTNTEYSFWVEEVDGSSNPIKSSVINATTLSEDPTSMGDITIVNTYSRSFDISWSPYPHATYGVECTYVTGEDDTQHYVPMATVTTGIIGNRNFDCYVFVKKLRGEMLTTRSINTTTKNISLPSTMFDIRRPTLYLWVARKSMSMVELAWTPANGNEQVTYAVNQDCCGQISSHLIIGHTVGGLNKYMSTSMSRSEPNTPLSNGGRCNYSVYVNSKDNEVYNYDKYKSNEVVAEFYSDLVVVPDVIDDDDDDDGDDDSMGETIHVSMVLLVTLATFATIFST